MIAYKLFKRRKNGTLGSLYINRKASVPVNEWVEAKSYPTKGFAVRPGWHCCMEPRAPHIKDNIDNRVWAIVEIDDYDIFDRPKSQGGQWYIAKRMKVVKLLWQ